MPNLKYEQTFGSNPKGLFIKLKARKPGETREVIYKTLFDTGAEISGVTQKVVDDLGLEKIKEVSMVDANGNTFMRPTYKVDLRIPTKPSTYEFRGVEVPLAASTQGEDILLGMNILSQCSFSLVKADADYKLILEIYPEKIS